MVTLLDFEMILNKLNIYETLFLARVVLQFYFCSENFSTVDADNK